MNTRTPRVRRAAASVTVAAVVGGLLLPLVATPAGAVEPTTTRRLQDQDRYGTAAAVAADTFPDGADSVVLATGEDFPDALAANGLAGALDAPVLLTLRNDLPAKTAAAIADLAPETVYVMGGTAAVSQAVEDELAADYTVERIDGEDRFETAAAAGAAIAATAAPTTPLPGSPSEGGVGSTSEGLTAVLANGLGFPDAVSGGPVAYAGSLPVLLSTPSSVPEATLTALEALGIEHVLVVGGTAVVSDAVETALEGEGYTTERLAGVDRWGTNVAVNRFAQAEEGYEFGGPTAYLSTGLQFADALTGGPAAGANTAPLLLTAPTSLPPATAAYLQTNGNAIDEIVAVGGTSAIAANVLTAAAGAAQVTENDTFLVTPTTAETRPLSTSALNSDGARTYEVSGLQAGGTYVIALLDAETVTTDAQGNVALSDYSPSDEASTSIESVNGTPTGAAGGPETVEEEGTATDDGTMTFTVDATEADQVVPVVFEDLDGNGTLTLSGTRPAEPFGVGGQTTWAPGEAANGTYTNVTVSQLSLSENYFVAGGRTYNYETTDRFRSNGTTITPTQFENMLTRGDRLDISYFRDAQSLFNVVLDAIPDISDWTASLPSATNPNLVRVSWNPSAQPDVVYTVYRDNGDGQLSKAQDVVVSPKGPSTSRDFVETATGATRYIVLPEGGTSGTGDGSSGTGEPIVYLTNEIVPGQQMFGLTNGTTVADNNGLAVLNAGDVWMLHFSRAVQVASNASITVAQGGTQVTLTNSSSNSSWTVSGSTITITLGAGADAAPDMAYGASTTITALSGVRDSAGTLVPVGALLDTALEDDGPDLMLQSTTCDVADTSCTIAFNEPVDPASAQSPASYTFSGAPTRNLTAVSLGADGRTVTLTFSSGLAAEDTIRPVGSLGGAVEDDDEQASTQAAFDFVR